jgi:pimeloyl-ACP methyl ester carboxylesterase
LWREQLVPDVQLQAGTIRYQDTGGSGPVVVLLHGLAMDGSLWRTSSTRCATSTAAWSRPCRWAATGGPCAPTPTCHPAESLRLQAEFLDAPDLREVTLVGNDSGLFQLTAAQHPQRIARLVICSCEAFDNFPRVCRVAPSRWPAGCRAG